MGELDPRTKKVRRIGVGVFLTLAVACIPIGVHLVQTRGSPHLWLTLLGAVLMLVLISLYALETAIAPIPEPMYAPAGDDTAMDEPGEASGDGAMLVEVEEVATHPPFDRPEDQPGLDYPHDRKEHTENPDAPVLVVPPQTLGSSAEDPSGPESKESGKPLNDEVAVTESNEDTQ
jgi:hypothetical protein